MRKSVVKNDRPDRVKNLILSPLMSALTRAFKPSKSLASPSVKKTIATQTPPVSLPAIRFEALEPRVLLSGDVNPAALTIAGAISVQGEQDHYEFTVQEPRRVVFDSLTNRGDLSWNLEGTSGQITSRPFNNTDYYASSPAFELTPGKYKLTVDGQNDALGEYSLRIIDADAAADITPGVAVSGTLDGGNKTSVYRFTGTAGDKFYYGAASLQSTGAYPSADWRLIDPFGRQEGGIYDVRSDRDTFTLQRTGEYLLLLEGYEGNTVPVDYQFNLRTVTDNTAPLTLDSTATANIDQPGQTANFTFNLTEATSVLFDKLTDANFYWSLTGPKGQQVARHWTNYNDYDNSFDGFEHLALEAGAYTLSVDLDGAATGSFPFRLVSANSAQTLLPGMLTTGSLDFARGSSIFKVTLTEGDKVYLDGRSVAGGSVGWRLIDPYGVRVNTSALTTAVDPFVVNATGDYWLVLDGVNTNAADATVSYQFALNKVPNVASTLNVGDVVSGMIATAGQATVYRFDLAVATQLVFDAQSNRSDFLWSLVGPRGSEISNRRFDQSDGTSGLSALVLPAGSYQLTVRGSGSATGAFAFKLLDLSSAAALTLDSAVNGTLTPANAALAYSFTAAAGDKVAFQSNSVSAGNATWRLIDRFGHDVAGASNLASNHSAVSLSVGGTYILLVEGGLDSAAPISFNVQLNAAGNQAPTALPDGDTLTVGTVVAGTLASWDATKTYRFTLASDSQLVMDNQGNGGSSAIWSLLGPRGTEVDQRSLYSSDANYNYSVLSLPAGDYALTVKGAPYNQYYYSGNGAYTFRLLDPATFPALTLGQQTAATRSPANATIGYRLNATAGTTLVLNSSESGSNYGNGGSTWRLIDSFGREVAPVSGANVGNLYVIPTTGVYTLLDEGYYYVTGTSNVTFTLAQQTRTSAPLSFNDQLSGNLAGRQSLADYSFTLDEAGTIVFDALDTLTGNAGNVQWLVTGPKGNVTGWNSLTNDYYGALYALPPGRYTITLRNTQDSAATYKFRVLNRDAAVALTPGVDVNEIIPAGESRLYRFNANAGEHFYFGGKNTYYATNEYCLWSLVDPFGRQVASGATYSDIPDITLTATGEYILVVSPVTNYSSPANAPRNVKFNLASKSLSLAALTLNDDISGSIRRPGETVKYSFTLVSPTTMLVDTGVATNPSSLSWSLSGPRGSEASMRSFNSAQDSLLSLPAGNYEFSVAYSDLSTGTYNFRLVDASTVPTLAIDGTTQLTLNPASHAQAYQLVVDDGGDFLFDPQTYARSAGWRIVDRLGNMLRSGDMSTATQPFPLVAGRYFFVVDGPNNVSSNDQYKFTVRRSVTTAQTLTVNTDINGSIDSIGQRYDYSFSINTPTTVLFDSLSNRSDLSWELTGPTGSLRSNISFNVADEGATSAPIRLDSAGVYRLRVTPRGNATGAFNFRLLDLANAEALPLDSAQILTLNPGSSAKVFSLDGNAGDYWTLGVTSVSGGSARVWVIDPDGNHLIEAANAVAGVTIAAAFKKTGRHTIVVEGAIGNSDVVDLSWTASLAIPTTAAVSVGSEATGATRAVGVPDKWNFALNAPSRLVVDGLSGLGSNWKLRAADGSLVKSGSFSNTDMLVLAAGTYTLEVRADNVVDLGNYSFRLLDVAAAETLTLDQAGADTLNAVHGAKIYRVNTTLENAVLMLDAAATNGEGGSLRVFDATGVLLESRQLPLLNTQVLGSGVSGERLIVIKGAAAATTALAYTLTAKQVAQNLIRTSLGVTLDGSIALQGDSVTYRIKVPFSQSLPARELIHDAGSSAISWRLIRVGEPGTAASWWPDVLNQADGASAYTWNMAAGEYDLTVVANAVNAVYSLQLLDSAAAAVLPATGAAGHLEQGRNALVYSYDLNTAAALHVQLDTAIASQLEWTLYDADRNVIAASDTAAALDTDALDAGRYVLVVAGQAEVSDSVDFNVLLTPLSNASTALSLGALVAGSLTPDDTTRSYALSVPFGTYVQIHDEGSDAGIRWQIRPVGGSANWNDLAASPNNGQDHEAVAPYTRYLSAGNYEFNVQRLSGDGSQNAADFKLRLIDLDNVPELPSNGVAATLASGTQVAAYRLEVAPGQRLRIETASANAVDISWVLFDPNKSVAAQGTSAGSFIAANLSGGRYTLVIKGQNEAAGSLNYTLNVSLVTLPERQLGQKIEGDLTAAQDAQTYHVKIPFSGYYQIHNTDSDDAIRWEMRRNGYTYADWTDVVPAQSAGADNEARYPHTRYFDAGDYEFSVSSNGSDQHYGLQIVDLENVPLLPQGGFAASFAPDNDVAVYRFDAGSNGTLNINVATANANAIGWVVYDRNKNVIAEEQSASTAVIQLGNGPYTLEVKRRALVQSLDFSVDVEPVTVAPIALSLNTTTPVSLAADANYRANYSFTINQRSTILFDALSAPTGANVSYTIRDAQGRELVSDFLDGSSGENALSLKPGDYKVEFSGYLYSSPSEGDQIDFSFSLLNAGDVSNPVITLDTPIDGTLVDGNETHVYRLDALAGDTILLSASIDAGASATWRLFNVDGVMASSGVVDGNESSIELRASGIYLLAIDGALSNGSGATYSVSATLDRHVDYPVATSTPVTLGAEMTDTLAAGETKGYRFTLAERSLVTISGSSTGSNDAGWDLRRASDYVGDGGSFSSSWHDASVLELEAGDYVLEAYSNSDTDTTDISFQIDDVVSAATVGTGSSIVASGASLYKMDLTAGQTYFIRPRLNETWSIYRPDFIKALDVYAGWGGQSGTQFIPVVSGTWYFAYTQGNSDDSALDMRSANPLTLNTQAEGTLTPNRLGDIYSVTLGETKRLYLDVSKFDGSAQITIFQGDNEIHSFYVESANPGSTSPFELHGGTYRIEINQGNNWSSNENAYSLRLLDFASANTLSADVEVSGSVLPGESAIYQFDAKAGQPLYYVPTDVGGLSGSWTLYDAFGEQIQSGDSTQSSPLARFSRSGTYFLVWDTFPDAGVASSYRFMLSSAPTTTAAALVIGNTVQETMPAGNVTRTYTFTLDTYTRLLFDAQQAEGDSVNWVLQTLDGNILANGSWTGAATDTAQILDLRADTYILRITSSSAAEASLAFRVSDMQNANALAIGDEVSGTVVPGAAAIFNIDVTAGDNVDYVPLSTGQLNGRWQLFDPNGGQVASGDLSTTVALPQLSQSGRYKLVWDTDAVAGNIDEIAYRFALKTHVLTLGTLVTGGYDYGTSAYQTYTLTVLEPTRLLMDVAQASGNGFKWTITRAGQTISQQSEYAASADASYNPIIELQPGTYRIALAPAYDYSYYAYYSSYAFRLMDLALAPALTLDTATTGSLPTGQAASFRLNAQMGDYLSVEPDENTSGGWRLVDEFGAAIKQGRGRGIVANLPRTGSYTLIWDTDGPYSRDSSTREYNFTVRKVDAPVPSALALDTLTTGTLSDDGTLTYRFDTTDAATLWLDPLNNPFDLHAEVFDASGVRLHAADYYYVANQAIKLPSAGTYTLKLRDVYNNSYARSVSFKLLDLSAATPLTAETPVIGTLDPANGVVAYRFSVADTASFMFDAISSAGSNLSWKLVSPYGMKLTEGTVGYDGAPYQLGAGEYLLLLDGNSYQSGSANYSFMVHTTAANLPLNTTITAALPAAGTVARYKLHLDQAATLAFDNLGTNSNLKWRLVGPSGVVFDQSMTNYSSQYDYTTGTYNYTNDFDGKLAAGDYTLTIDSYNGAVDSYSFRVLNLEVATTVVPGTPTTTVVTPINGVQLYRFDAVAGERYYFDALATISDPGPYTGSRAVPQWTLLDPLGRKVFGSTQMGYASYNSYYDYTLGQYLYRNTFTGYDQEPVALKMTGTYMLVLEGRNTETVTQSTVSFNLVKVPDAPPVVLDTLLVKPAPDLTVNSVTLDPAGSLQTGQTVNVQWVLENRGVLPTSGNWSDRIIVRNLDTGIVIADISVPYDATDVNNGAIAVGDARTRSRAIQLPDGTAAAGRLSIAVLTDSSNVIKESNASGTGEGNNSLVIETNVTLAPYADLLIENFTLNPSSDFQPGQNVSVTWSSANRGTKAVEHAWSERLLVRNLSTNEIVADVILRDTLGEGVLNVGATRARSTQFVWPSGASATGRFSIRVIADSAAEIPEANLGGTGESNNTTELTCLSGPDLRIKNLRVDTTGVHAGGQVTLRWEDWNDGSSSTAAVFDDRIVVKNVDANLVLLDTSISYDPLALTNGQVNGPIQAGEHRERSFTFRLPEGIKGAGNIGITITADQNSAGQGVLFETNLSNDAETNNSAVTQTSSAAKPYADLRLDTLSAPATGIAGQPVTLNWTVSNHGQADTTAAWNDQVVLSNDAVIGNADDIVIGTVRHTGGLHIGESYAQSATINVPVRADGRYYLGVRSDSGAEAVEPDTRADNNSSASVIDLITPYADLTTVAITVPENALSGENILVTWVVSNNGNATTDLALWNDRVVLSRDTTLSADDIVLSGSVTHAGLLAPGQSYTGRATLTLPRDLSGDYYVVVDTNTNRSVTETGHTGNNSAPSIATLHIGLAPTPDLVVSDVAGPTVLRPGDAVSITYTASNNGTAAATGSWRDRIYVDRGASGLYEVASVFNTTPLEVGMSVARSVNFTLPSWFWEGDFRWVVKTDTDNTVFERSIAEDNNQAAAAATVHVARPDLSVGEVHGPGLVQSGGNLHVDWTVSNAGGLVQGNWVDQVFLSKNGVLRKMAEVVRSGPLAAGASYSAFTDFTVPLDFSGEYEVVVITDGNNVIDDYTRTNNRATQNLTVNLAPYADLAVSAVTAPARVIDDPAPFDVSWTVTNQGTGEGRTDSWTDRIILSLDDTVGNYDDRVVGEYRHVGALAAGDSYTRSEHMLLPAATSGRFKLFVVSDAKSEVFENNSEANNIGRISHDVDVMAIPYADLQVESLTTQGTAASGRPLRVSWDVINNGIGLTNSAEWSDQIWLSRNPDGTDVVTQLGSASHIGQLAVGDRYSRSIDVTLPEGIEGNFYINVRTGGPFEFVFTNNNTDSTVAIPVALSKSPDLKVETITLPATAQEGSVIDVSWSVVNQGEAKATGVWVDTVVLIPANGADSTITLGSFTYDRGLESGIRYTRTEQVRLPAKIEGLYRVKVISNANNQLYEYGAARNNNTLLSTDVTEVSLNDRPDLRVGTMVVPDHVTAGTSASIRYTIANQGPSAASGRWKDKVFLSLDAALSGDDVLVGQFDNGGALAPSESYSTDSASVNIPIRYRGDAYLIVVTDGNNNIDEYPNEGNNIKAAHFYVDPIPFGDLIASDVVAPNQAVHGSSIEVRYKVTNLGSDTTRGETAAVSSWTDSVWLARDKRRPGAYKGDVLLGSVVHNGNLAVGEDYLGTTQVSIPDGTLSGNYFITVWSDTYDAILEDTLVSNLNPDDPNQVDNNNYKARPISILGITPPDLTVTDVTALSAADAGGNYTFSYTVQNRGDIFTGNWTDSVFITDNPDLDAAKEVWAIGSYSQQRTLGNSERYSVTQTVQLAPSVKGRYVVVKTDAEPVTYRSWYHGDISETDETNNVRAASSLVSVHPADLQVTSIETQPENFSGEETTISWTVTNQGDAVWAGTRGWVDSIYFSRDPVFIQSRAIALGAAVHSNVNGLAAGASYTTSAKVKLPPGTDGSYYIYVITDSEHDPEGLTDSPQPVAQSELLDGDNVYARDRFYATSAYEGERFDNNMARGTLNITYREPDLQIDTITVSDPNPSSGQPITVTWTATNRGTRETRTNTWLDGVYLSRDDSLDNSDYPLVDRGHLVELQYRVHFNYIVENDKPKNIKPGESYTASATFNLPESISGNFHIIVKADTSTTKDFYPTEPSTIRDGLDIVSNDYISDSVKEFKDEGNNVASIALPITLVTPPDLQVAEVTAPASVLAGQNFNVSYRVVNAGGNTPSDQTSWNDLIYLSKDRFLDVNQDRYVGYIAHGGGLAAAGSYNGNLTVTAPRDLEGAYYVFVITDPARAWGSGEFGKVREFGKEQNNSAAAVQPIIVETPPPADLKVSNVVIPSNANVGDDIQINYTIVNDSVNTAYGHWTDALYLSSDNSWDLGDTLLGKVDHNGDLEPQGSYSGILNAKLPPMKDGNWRIIVRPDLYNEVFEGKITYTATGLNLPPGEANNRVASGSTLQVQVPVLNVASPLQTTLSAGQARLYKVSVASGETLRVMLDSSATEGSNELYIR